MTAPATSEFISTYVSRARDQPLDLADGLTAFAAMWGLAALFGVAGDYNPLSGNNGPLYLIASWVIVLRRRRLIEDPAN